MSAECPYRRGSQAGVAYRSFDLHTAQNAGSMACRSRLAGTVLADVSAPSERSVLGRDRDPLGRVEPATRAYLPIGTRPNVANVV